MFVLCPLSSLWLLCNTVKQHRQRGETLKQAAALLQYIQSGTPVLSQATNSQASQVHHTNIPSSSFFCWKIITRFFKQPSLNREQSRARKRNLKHNKRFKPHTHSLGWVLWEPGPILLFELIPLFEVCRFFMYHLCIDYFFRLKTFCFIFFKQYIFLDPSCWFLVFF